MNHIFKMKTMRTPGKYTKLLMALIIFVITGGYASSSAASVTVIAPNGNGYYSAGSIVTISYSYSAVSTVNIDLSIDGGVSWSPIVSATTATGNYNWTVPATPSSNCLIKVTDNATLVSDQSNSVFTIGNASFSVSASIVNATCYGGTNGTISVNVTGGTTPYNYSWSPVSNSTPTVGGVPAGTYSVTITDALGATSGAIFYTITQPHHTTTSTDSYSSTYGHYLPW
jgi:large repetitive protein